MAVRCAWNLSPRRRPLLLAIFALVVWVSIRLCGRNGIAFCQERFPLTWEYVHMAKERGRGKGEGGVWYIPPHWLQPSDERPRNIIEAAQLASRLATASSRMLPYSTIPQIIHQQWGNADVGTWPLDVVTGVERWLDYAVANDDDEDGMAYLLWLDDGCDELMSQARPELIHVVNAMPLPVEKFDIFRIVALNVFGGIYADTDTIPLRNPRGWLDQTDILPWQDPETGVEYGHDDTSRPIRLVLGIEADNPPDTNTYWRLGYHYPVQLTQWALAAAPNQPVLTRLLSTFVRQVQEMAEPYQGDLDLAASAGAFREDPIQLTGPGAITVAAMSWLEENAGLRWNALTGLDDGGRSKVVGDTVVLPITGMSPGRGRFGNMGSKPITDPAARLQHNAQGSWKKFDLKLEYGKFCRTAFGRCRNWSMFSI